ncbi:hypothetical protein A2U01_0079452, partial [Trifolium medium]|nr:hypothetical protein [Trifolium medium]
MAIPSKGDAPAAVAGGGIVEAVQPSPKKRKTSTSHKGQILGLTSGSTGPIGDSEGGAKDLPTVDSQLGAASLSSRCLLRLSFFLG